MTIGIGVLATGTGFKPDTLILVSDTRGSVGDSYTTPGLHKLSKFPSEKLYAVASGSMERAAELLGVIQHEFSVLRVRDHGPINSALLSAVMKYRTERGWNEIFPNFLVTKGEWYSNTIDREQRAQVLEAWRRFDVGCDLIVGTFSDTGQALLYLIPSAGVLDDYTNPTAICHVLLKTNTRDYPRRHGSIPHSSGSSADCTETMFSAGPDLPDEAFLFCRPKPHIPISDGISPSR